MMTTPFFSAARSQVDPLEPRADERDGNTFVREKATTTGIARDGDNQKDDNHLVGQRV